jgi:alanine racemase
MTRAAEARIDLSALQSNLQRVRKLAPAARAMAVIKANGYGHGMLRVARALAAADAFGVACLEEALSLRDAGITQPILLLEGFYDASELEPICRNELAVVVHQDFQIDILERSAIPAPIQVWLKIDTGMHRLGFDPRHVAHAHGRLLACNNVAQPLRLMTHLADADDRNGLVTQRQIDCFNTTVTGIKGERSIANSAATIAWPQSHTDWVRPGIMLYGISPFNDTDGAAEGLRPVMTFTSKLIAINKFRKGDRVGYGGEWECPEDMAVGVVAVGYGDGYPRRVSSGISVLISGQRVPVIGRVSMDMITVDLRSLSRVQVGDTVTLWGNELPVEEIAHHAKTIPYELVCRVTQRVRFVEC